MHFRQQFPRKRKMCEYFMFSSKRNANARYIILFDDKPKLREK